MDVSIPMTVLGGLQFFSHKEELSCTQVSIPMTVLGGLQLAEFLRTLNMMDVSIPMTVLGGLQSASAQAEKQARAGFNTDDGIRRAAIGYLDL